MGSVVFLGTGTSHGIPVVGCECDVCRSADPRNSRFRSSVLIEQRSTMILVDTPPELRLQLLRAGVSKVDAVFFTHSHADHLFGFDDLRTLSLGMPGGLPCYASPETASDIRNAFPYVLRPAPPGGGIPIVRIVDLVGEVHVGEVRVTPVPVLHGLATIYGFRIGQMAYITDCSHIPDEAYELLTGLDLLILNALRFRPHPTHFNLDQALDEIRRIGPRRAYLTHIAHDIDHSRVSQMLPGGVFLAHDGLAVAFED